MPGKKKNREAFSSTYRFVFFRFPTLQARDINRLRSTFLWKKKKKYWKKIYCVRSKYREMRRIVSQIFISRKIDGKNKFILARGEGKKLCVIYSQSNRDRRMLQRNGNARCSFRQSSSECSCNVAMYIYASSSLVLVPRLSMLPCRYSLSDIITN